nr:hypothetical protein [Tanacetum cinerariifolium]
WKRTWESEQWWGCLGGKIGFIKLLYDLARGDDASRRLSISDAIVPLVEPLSAKNLVGETNTSSLPKAFAATTALSTTFVQASSVSPMPVSDYEVVNMEPQVEASSSPNIIFE